MPSRTTHQEDKQHSTMNSSLDKYKLGQSQLEHSLLQQSEQPASDRNPEELDKIIEQFSQAADDKAIDRVINLYKKTILKLEKKLWNDQPAADDISQYQSAFKILEKLYDLKTDDKRYNFKIVIPVADRPQHLKHCLDSLITLCRNYEYGGFKNNRFNKISVLIADDSKDKSNIKLHKEYCKLISDQGIDSEYFGLEDQLSLVNEITKYHGDLSNMISSTEHIDKQVEFSHKGASIMRNITYLKLKQCLTDDNTLIYFIDSDQEFCINTIHSDENYYAINYFYYLNDIFKTQDVSIVTGKVVGDPPVSPSVMAGNFQQDVNNFLDSMSRLKPADPCQFHHHEKQFKDEAAYHDMANLFGFSDNKQVFDYHCTLKDAHNNADCFTDFSSKLARFFYGEHPTRKTYFNYDEGFSSISPARTVYTGNYVIKPENLNYFIPFARLKLRMAGPVLGRLLKAKLQHKFVSANLPMLHNRTIESTGKSEFRAGVASSRNTIDLSNEFIRQFYGDVMLFSMEKITAMSFPGETVDSDLVRSILLDTYQTIRQYYIDKHDIILRLRAQIEQRLNDQCNWWNKDLNESIPTETARLNISHFLENIQSNFSEETDVYQQITSQQHAQIYLDKLLNSIQHYQADLDSWNNALRH